MMPPTAWQHPMRILALAGLIAVLSLLAVGCESTPKAEGEPDAAAIDGEQTAGDPSAASAQSGDDDQPVDTGFELTERDEPPKIGDLAARDPDLRPGPQPVDQIGGMFSQPEARIDPATLQLIRIDLPLDAPLDQAWRLLDRSTVSRAAQASWQLNGLRVGTLKLNQVKAFIDALERVSGRSNRFLRVSGVPVAIASSPTLRGPTRVDLTSPPFPPEQRAVVGGRCRLLARVDRDRLDRVWLDLIPQHYVPENPLMPRNPLEGELDGTLFKRLELRGPVWPGQCLIIALGPAPQKSDNALIAPERPTEQDDRPQNQPDEQDPEPGNTQSRLDDRPRADRSRNDLGWRLFTGQRFNRPLQTILLITTVQR